MEPPASTAPPALTELAGHATLKAILVQQHYPFIGPENLHAVAQFVTNQVLSGAYTVKTSREEGCQLIWSSCWTCETDFLRLMYVLRPHLTSLRFSFSATHHFLKPLFNHWLIQMSRLQSLTIAGDTTLGDKSVAELLIHLPNLHRFCLIPAKNQPIGKQTTRALQMHTNLHTLVLHNTQIPSAALSALTKNLPSLTSLGIGWRPYAVSDVELSLNGKHLTTVHLTFAAIDLYKLGIGAPNLTSLSLEKTVLANLGNRACLPFTCLKALRLDDVWTRDQSADRFGIGNTEFAIFLSSCVRLKRFALMRCAELTNTSLLTFSRGVTSLLHLTIGECEGVTSAGWARLVAAQPKLQELTLSQVSLCPHLCQAMQNLTALRQLKVAGLHLGSKGFPKLRARFHVVSLEGCTLKQGTMQALLSRFRNGDHDDLARHKQALYRPSELPSNPWVRGLVSLYSQLEAKEPSTKKRKALAG